MKVRKIVVRLRGGMGNQLFIYFNALFYSSCYGYKLEIDKYSGFRRDKKYKRTFNLERFEFNYLNSCSYFDSLGVGFGVMRKVLIYFKSFLRIRYYDFLDDDIDYRDFINECQKLKCHKVYYSSLSQKSFYCSDELIKNECLSYYTKRIGPIRSNFQSKNREDSLIVLIHFRFFSSLISDRFINSIRNIISEGYKNVYYVSDDLSLACSLVEEHGLNIMPVNTSELAIYDDFDLLVASDILICQESTYAWWAGKIGSMFFDKIIVKIP